MGDTDHLRISADVGVCQISLSVTKYLVKYPYKICYQISISVTKYLDKSQYKICYVDVS